MENSAILNNENWHKQHCSKGTINQVKELLKEETKILPYSFEYLGKTVNTTTKKADFIPILHNEGKIYLQFCGWSINLLNDGTWHWEDTTGG